MMKTPPSQPRHLLHDDSYTVTMSIEISTQGFEGTQTFGLQHLMSLPQGQVYVLPDLLLSGHLMLSCEEQEGRGMWGHIGKKVLGCKLHLWLQRKPRQEDHGWSKPHSPGLRERMDSPC